MQFDTESNRHDNLRERWNDSATQSKNVAVRGSSAEKFALNGALIGTSPRAIRLANLTRFTTMEWVFGDTTLIILGATESSTPAFFEW